MVRDIFMLTYYLGGINLRDLLAYDFKNKNDNALCASQNT